MKADEEVVYGFCTTLHRDHFVGDALFERAKSTLGDYTLVSMVLNVAEIPLPAGV